MKKEKQNTEQEQAPENRRKIRKIRGGIIIPRDPTIDPSQFAGMWADRDDITVELLRRKAWGYGDR